MVKNVNNCNFLGVAPIKCDETKQNLLQFSQFRKSIDSVQYGLVSGESEFRMEVKFSINNRPFTGAFLKHSFAEMKFF